MTLTLDHTQRLNLHALMGAQRASVDEVRLWWRLQDMIDLTPEERTQINYRLEKLELGDDEVFVAGYTVPRDSAPSGPETPSPRPLAAAPSANENRQR